MCGSRLAELICRLYDGQRTTAAAAATLHFRRRHAHRSWKFDTKIAIAVEQSKVNNAASVDPRAAASNTKGSKLGAAAAVPQVLALMALIEAAAAAASTS